jgi:hypothetical protein
VFCDVPGCPQKFQNMWNTPKNSRMLWTVLKISRGPNFQHVYIQKHALQVKVGTFCMVGVRGLRRDVTLLIVPTGTHFWLLAACTLYTYLGFLCRTEATRDAELKSRGSWRGGYIWDIYKIFYLHKSAFNNSLKFLRLQNKQYPINYLTTGGEVSPFSHVFT